MTLPVMEPGLDGDLLEAWARAIDAGPFSSLCFGERMAFDNPDALTLLGACAAWTERVRLVTTVIVPQLHDPVMLAKALATADLLSKGRLSVGLGVGGRDEDYVAAGVDPALRTLAELADRAAVMKRVWAGDRVVEACLPVGPAPVQPGGPELLVGALGPRSIRRAATWADGLAGMTMDLDLAGVAAAFGQARAAWSAEGRPPPRLTTSFWFAIGDGARDQLDRHLRHYLNWLPSSIVEAMLPSCGFAGSGSELLGLLKRLEDLGADEVCLIPTDGDVGQVHRVADLIA